MSTQQLSLQNQPKLGENNGWAVVFLIMGAPHIYNFLRRRSQQQPIERLPKLAVWTTALLAGGLSLLAF